MKPEGLLLCSQGLAIGPCPESGESTLHKFAHYFLKIHFNIILSSTPMSHKYSLFLLSFLITNFIYAISHASYIFTHLFTLHLITIIIFGDEYIL